jgi:hypothetical protein
MIVGMLEAFGVSLFSCRCKFSALMCSRYHSDCNDEDPFSLAVSKHRSAATMSRTDRIRSGNLDLPLPS